jgi:N-glycosylase/DNA lyase
MPDWTPWKKFNPPVYFSHASLTETLGEGQAFRWKCDNNGIWTGQWELNIVRVKLNKDDELLWQCPTSLKANVEKSVNAYYASDLDFDMITDSLPWRSDPVLKSAMDIYPRMRILKQPIGETLFVFLCSSSKHIRQIKEMCELTAENYGSSKVNGFYSLPSWNTLNQISEADLRKCKLGYRAKYIKGTAAFLDGNPDYLESIEKMPYHEAREKLIALPGVGEKIADCVLLYGAGMLESFPVDTWVCKAMSKLYGLNDWKLEQIAQFGRSHFGQYAGLAQQYLFTAHRRGKI